MIIPVACLVLLPVTVNLFAGKAVAFQPRILVATTITTTPTSRTRTTPSTTMLHGFWIFGGNKDERKGQNRKVSDDIASGTGGKASSSTDPSSPSSASVASVTNVMESMKRYETAQRVARSATATLNDLSNTFVEGVAADGKIKVIFNGQSVPVGVQIDENYFKSIVKDGSGSGGLAELSSELTKAMKDANIKAASKLDDKMKSLYNDFGFDAP